MDGSLKALLTEVRGALPGGRANGRTVAALTDNPGCTRRRVIDTAGIRAPVLAKRAGSAPTSGQSPFAIASGTMFERRLKEKGYEPLLSVLREQFSLHVSKPRVLDLNHTSGVVGSKAWPQERARKTDEALSAMARGEESAPNLVDHPVLIFELAGVPMYLEPDALALGDRTRCTRKSQSRRTAPGDPLAGDVCRLQALRRTCPGQSQGDPVDPQRGYHGNAVSR